jgi:hypothetical protein
MVERTRLGVGDLLPALSLPTASAERVVNLRESSRDSWVILFLPRSAERAHGYVRTLVDAAASILVWDARLVLVVAGDMRDARELHETTGGRVPVVADTDGLARAHFDSDTGLAVLVIADRYGQIYSLHIDACDALLAPAEIEEWVKFLATQCPECGVIDEPGHGEWAVG